MYFLLNKVVLTTWISENKSKLTHQSTSPCVWCASLRMLLYRFDVQFVVSNWVRCTQTAATDTPCLSDGCSSCPGCNGTRAARCVLLHCSQTAWTLWSWSLGSLRSAGKTHDDWQQYNTEAVPVDSRTWVTREAHLTEAFICLNMGIDTAALICGSPP